MSPHALNCYLWGSRKNHLDDGPCRVSEILPLPVETRVVDSLTGGEKGSKLSRFDLLPWDAIWALAEHYGRGAEKYADRNWEKGYRWGLSHAALHRHLAAWWNGEDIDAETGSNHMLAVAWHALALWWWQAHAKGTDDRPVQSARDRVE